VRGHVLIGAAFGARSPVRHPSDPLLVELDAGAALELPAESAEPAERAVFVIGGELDIAGRALAADRLAVLCAARRRGSPRSRRPAR